jgi:hypothetical protein
LGKLPPDDKEIRGNHEILRKTLIAGVVIILAASAPSFADRLA